jgi:hypothetical protein
MHRYELTMSSGPAGGRRTVAAAAARRCCAAEVIGGILPSGGSTTSEVRLSKTRSIIPTEFSVEVVLLKRSWVPLAARKTASPPAKSLFPSLKSSSARFFKAATS